ncbi:MAG: nucleoside-diphosphate sugar epimerase/dehydratase [Candidatus Pacebacteria bacterium]|nr:nucleoside-diphosphate sugar epimerase/dehydratase [Candidatus Paceibacterota bacterium]
MIKKILVEKRKNIRLMFFLASDAFLVSLSVFLAFYLRFEGKIPDQYLLQIGTLIASSLVILLISFFFFKLYSFTWIYVSTTELISLIKAVSFGYLVLIALLFIFRDHSVLSGFPRSVLPASYLFIILFAGAIRFAKRIYLQIFLGVRNGGKERTLIVGAGDAGEQILRSIQISKDNPFLPVGFVDDELSKQGILIHGVKVMGKIKDIPEIAKEKRVEGLIIALPSAGTKIIKEAVENGRKSGLKKIKIIPPIAEVINGRIGVSALREVEMDDLLGREPVALNKEQIEKFIKDKRVLVTGAAGSIGSELCRQIMKFGPRSLFLLDQDETGIFNIDQELKKNFFNVTACIGDIRDKGKMEDVFRRSQPEVVFHAAAYKHVPLMEAHPDEAVKNNILGTKVLTDVAVASGVGKFVFISTDKAVNPASVMGASKRIGEMICCLNNEEKKTKFVSVRFGNVLGSRGSVIPIFKEKIRRRESIEITHPEMKRYFMTTPEACLLVLQAGAIGQGGEVLVLNMGDPIKIIDLASELIRLSGLEPDKDIPIVFTNPRPGEKFFEETLTAEEGCVATQNEKISMAKLSKIDRMFLEKKIEELKEVVEREDREGIISIFKELMPNYKSNI